MHFRLSTPRLTSDFGRDRSLILIAAFCAFQKSHVDERGVFGVQLGVKLKRSRRYMFAVACLERDENRKALQSAVSIREQSAYLERMVKTFIDSKAQYVKCR